LPGAAAVCLGRSGKANLEAIVQDGSIDLICFTGDLAQGGKSKEYMALMPFIDDLLMCTGVTRDRLFVVPGNHDIDRGVAKAAYRKLRGLGDLEAEALSRWMAGQLGPPRLANKYRDDILERQGAYRTWVRDVLGRPELLPTPDTHPRLGYRVSLRLPGHPFDVHVIGLDSAWLAGGNDDARKLRLTEDQIGRLADDGLTGFRLALIHHPLGDLADGEGCRDLLASRVDLLLRGHLHETRVVLWSEPDSELREVATGCLYQSDKYANGCTVIDLRLDDFGRPSMPYRFWFRGWSHHGFWADDDKLYRGSSGGRLTWPSTTESHSSHAGNGHSTTSYPSDSEPRPKAAHRSTDATLALYRQKLLVHLERFRSIAIDASQTQFSTIYEPLDLRLAQPKGIITVDEIHTSMKASSCRLIVEDGAGMGKSSIMRRIALNLLRDTQEIPILLSLRKIHMGENMIDFATRSVAEGGQLPSGYIRDSLVSGGISFLLDGFDEVDTESQSTVLHEIQTLEMIAPNNRYVISSRPEQALVSLENFEVARVCPLSRDGAKRLITRYGSISDPSKAQKLISRIETADLATMDEFLSSPMMVALLFRTFVDAERLPARRTDFFAAVYKDLFSDHDLRKGGYRRKRQSRFSQEQFLIVVERVAWTTSLRGAVESSVADFVREIDSALASLGMKGESAAFLHDILQSVSLMYDDGGRISWIHRSLQDYFAASYVHRLPPDRRHELLGHVYLMLRERSFQGFLAMYRDLDNKSFRSGLVLRVLRDYGEQVYGDPNFLETEHSDETLSRRIRFQIESFRVSRFRIESLRDLALRLGIRREELAYVAHDIRKRHPMLLNLTPGSAGAGGGGTSWEKNGYFYEIQVTVRNTPVWHVLALAANAHVSPEYDGLYWRIPGGTEGLQPFQEETEALFEFIPPDTWVLNNGQTLELVHDLAAEATPLVVKYAQRLAMRAHRLLDPIGVVAIRTRIEQEIAEAATFRAILSL
jgi:predicted MPP superfamily phosphohydrolase